MIELIHRARLRSEEKEVFLGYRLLFLQPDSKSEEISSSHFKYYVANLFSPWRLWGEETPNPSGFQTNFSLSHRKRDDLSKWQYTSVGTQKPHILQSPNQDLYFIWTNKEALFINAPALLGAE